MGRCAVASETFAGVEVAAEVVPGPTVMIVESAVETETLIFATAIAMTAAVSEIATGIEIGATGISVEGVLPLDDQDRPTETFAIAIAMHHHP